MLAGGYAAVSRDSAQIRSIRTQIDRESLVRPSAQPYSQGMKSFLFLSSALILGLSAATAGTHETSVSEVRELTLPADDLTLPDVSGRWLSPSALGCQ